MPLPGLPNLDVDSGWYSQRGEVSWGEDVAKFSSVFGDSLNIGRYSKRIWDGKNKGLSSLILPIRGFGLFRDFSFFLF